MTNFTDITKTPGFDQQQYNQLLESAKLQNVDVSLVDSKLLDAVNSGKSFSEALKIVSTELPTLAPPKNPFEDLKGWIGTPAPGALVMALITQLSADQRAQNKEMMWAQTEAIQESMQDQAKKMRTMAAVQLALGIAASATTIAGGIAQGVVAGKSTGIDTSTDAGKQLGSGMAMLQSTKAQGIGTAIGGGAGLFSAGAQFAGSMYQAEFKEMEADQEKMRALKESMSSLNDGLKELIQKSISSQENIQQSKNQATARILA